MSNARTKPAKTLDAWTKAKVHEDITLPSGFQIDLEVPNLPQLIANGDIPNELVDVAIGVASGRSTPGRDVIEQSVDFAAKVVSLAVKAPEITEQDVLGGKVPYEDVEMIVEIATRQRDLDAVGKHIGGLDKLQEFRTFRRLDSIE